MAAQGGQQGVKTSKMNDFEKPKYEKSAVNSKEVIPNKPFRKDVLDDFSKKLFSLDDSVAAGLTKLSQEKPKVVNSVLFVKQNKSPQEFLKASVEVNSKPFENFVAHMSACYGIPQDKLLADPALKAAFMALKNLEMNYGNRLKNKKEYFKLCDKLDFIIAGYVREKKEVNNEMSDINIKESRKLYMREMKVAKFDSKVAEKLNDPNLTPEQKLPYQEYWNNRKLNNEKLEKDEITKEEHDTIGAELREKLALDTNDKDLINEGKELKENLVEIPAAPVVEAKKAVSLPLQASDKPVTDKAQIQQVMSDIQSDSFRLDLHDGGASVIVGPEKYPMEIHVYKNEQTNKFVFFVADHYAEGGVVRVESDDLSEALDGRYLDSYISEKIGAVSDENDSPNKVPDNMLVKLGQRLLGSGKSRGYKVEGENREVLDMMIKVLEQPSVKYPNYYKKVEALNIFLQKEENVDGLRKKLLAGEKPSVDAL